MFQNYFKTAFRNLVKHKVFSFINILGLALGIAACLLILQHVRFERSYDNFHKNSERIYRVQQDRYEEGKLSTQWAAGSPGIGPMAIAQIPEVESFSKLYKTAGVILYNDKKFREEKVFYATDDFLPMFSYKVIQGKTKGALAEPNTAVITKSTAKKYFGEENAVGKVVSFNREQDYKITAVVEDMPANTHLKFEVLLSFINYVKLTSPDAETGWYWDGFYTYLLLKPNADVRKIETNLTALAQKQYDPEGESKHKIIDLKLQPLQDIHLTSNYMMEAEVNGNGQSVSFLLMIAIFIIVIAWINYINLATARAIERAKEVGIRKVMGSYRIQLIRQFLLESVVINLLAVLLAFLLIIIFLPLFNSLTGKDVSFSLLTDGGFWIAVVIIFLSGAFLSGLYPSFVLSSFKPIEVLKGKLSKTSHGNLLRKGLVIIQFAASVALVIGTYSVYRQLKYMEAQKLGVNIDQTLVLRGPEVVDSTYNEKLTAFKNELLSVPGIKKMTAASSVPGSKVNWNAGGITLVGSDKTNQYRVFGVDYNFVETFGLKIIKGRDFSPQMGDDSSAVLFNEAAVKTLGFNTPDEALNKRINFWGEVYTIVGIVANHHQESLRENYDSYIYRLSTGRDHFYALKAASAGVNNWERIIKSTEEKWSKFFPGNPFEYFFLDEQFQNQYEADRKFGRTFGLFAVLAIIVACLGLFGLVSFVTTQRTKEIGIRKISGAGVSSIVLLLTKDFIKPILISFAIATPVTYYLINEWLQNYAFKISINPWMFILPATFILIVALVTISTQTIKAATDNPIKSLRTE